MAKSGRTWNFFLPSTGSSHQCRVDNIGVQGQAVFIDGVRQPGTYAYVFAGPGESSLELRNSDHKGWVLLVNGMQVEEYNPNRSLSNKDHSMRELRSTPDGSYVIAPCFDVSQQQDLDIAAQFQFRVADQVRELQISVHDSFWQVIVDGQAIDRVQLPSNYSYKNIRALSGEQIPVLVYMNVVTTPSQNSLKIFAPKEIKAFQLTVNGYQIPPAWTKETGRSLHFSEPPVVDLSTATENPGRPYSNEDVANKLQDIPYQSNIVADMVDQIYSKPDTAPVVPGLLPQGVSYDGTSHRYQANIRSATGKFVFLGDFPTSEEAHQKYLEALPIYCPTRGVAADIPQH